MAWKEVYVYMLSAEFQNHAYSVDICTPPPHLNFQKKNVCHLFFKIKLIFVVYKLYKFSVQINNDRG